MHDDDGFLRKILENPADDTARLVYADWLDERASDEEGLKSQFLRLTVQLNERRPGTEWRTAIRDEMQPLAARLSTDWLEIVSRLPIDLCGAKRMERQVELPVLEMLSAQFSFVCPLEWDDLTPTGDTTVRHCETCRENVHYCDTIVTARDHAQQGHCVAVDLGIIRRENDLIKRRLTMGIMAQGSLWDSRMVDRTNMDDVSREREERKRKDAD